MLPVLAVIKVQTALEVLQVKRVKAVTRVKAEPAALVVQPVLQGRAVLVTALLRLL